MAKVIPLELITHIQRISRLYKLTVRNIQAFCTNRHVFRYKATLCRAEFDEIVNEKDMIKAKSMLLQKEDELTRTKHVQPIIFPDAPGGVADGRLPIPPDCVVDFWHPCEKAQFPTYFATRELRKQQYVAMWERKYGKPVEKDMHD